MRGPVMCDLNGLTLEASEKKLLLNPYVGGLILFSRNFESHQQVSELVKQVRAVRSELIIAVDQEGGRVQRFKNGFTKLPPMQRFGELLKKDKSRALLLARNCGWLMASEVRSTGVDFSFAPVIDVDCNFSSIIGDRAFSESADQVVELAEAFIEGMHSAGMASVGKHYPGHGAVKGDSHLMTPIDDRSFAEIEQRELLPFKKLIQQNKLDGIMPAHVVYSQLDDKPAVFSTFWLQKILRQQLNFKGVIFSDDLCMEGAAVIGDFPRRADVALEAGCDMILICNQRSATLEILQHLEKIKPKINDCFSAYRNQQVHASMTDIRSDSRYAVLREAFLEWEILIA